MKSFDNSMKAREIVERKALEKEFTELSKVWLQMKIQSPDQLEAKTVVINFKPRVLFNIPGIVYQGEGLRLISDGSIVTRNYFSSYRWHRLSSPLSYLNNGLLEAAVVGMREDMKPQKKKKMRWWWIFLWILSRVR